MILRARRFTFVLGLFLAFPAAAELAAGTETTSSRKAGKSSLQTEATARGLNFTLPGGVEHNTIRPEAQPVARWSYRLRAWLRSEQARKLREALRKYVEKQLAEWKQRHAQEAKKKEAELFKSQFGTGGSVLVTGLIHHTENNCIEEPSLTVADVTSLARESFGLEDFNPEAPVCKSGNYALSGKYGTCCWRSQVSHFENMYDTGVAAMALGATQDEAFAPFLHARALARTLQECDPALVKKENRTFQMRTWETPEQQALGPEESKEIFMIAFPKSYEMLHEIYHTMLIERLRLRRTPVYPSSDAMGQLFINIGSRRRAAVLSPIDCDGDMLPNLADSGDVLNMTQAAATSSRPVVSSVIRVTGLAQRVFEIATRRYRDVDDSLCCASTGGKPATFFPFVTAKTVENVYEACCADECNFLSIYGKLFGDTGANCCRGCNRHSCKANTRATADKLSLLSRITTPWKKAYSPVMFSMLV